MERLAKEADELRAGVTTQESRLVQLKTRLAALTTLVRKQSAHFRSLTSSKVVAIADYKDMRLKHNQHLRQMEESKEAIESVEQVLVRSKKRLTDLDSLVAAHRLEREKYGTVIQLRKA